MVTLEMIGFVVLLLVLCAAIVGLVIISKVCLLLKNYYVEKWQGLGAPSLVNSSVSNNILFWSFILKKEYLGLNNIKLAKLCDFLRVYFMIYLVIFTGSFLLTVLIIYKGK